MGGAILTTELGSLIWRHDEISRGAVGGADGQEAADSVPTGLCFRRRYA